MFKKLALLAAATVLATAASADNEWHLNIKRVADGWTAHLTGTQEYGNSRNRVRGSGVRVEKVRALTAFSRIRVDGPVDVRLVQSGVDQATVMADDNIEPLVETVVEGDALVVRLKRDAGFSTRQAVVVKVEARAVQSVALNASGDLSLDRFKADSLALSLVGSGDARLGLVELRDLSVNITGSGDVRVAGRADQQSWTVNGSGDVDARALSGRKAKVAINGSGDIDLGVVEELDVQLSGSGDLSYSGRPAIRQSLNGSGEIHRR